MNDKQPGTVVGIVGLGYVGLPLALALERHFKVIGYDRSPEKLDELGKDPDVAASSLRLTADAADIGGADAIIICVPTPVTAEKEPDLSYITGAAETVGRHLRRGSTVVLESTVYPGVTEEIMVPVLEKESGLKCGEGFRVAYSPERINPGDDVHTLESMVKVVGGMDEATGRDVAAVYGKVTAGVHLAPDIKTAEAAKVIENIQRDLNIALINELAKLFSEMGIDTGEVLAAAGTKWNFHAYQPGLVGGHCIPVDPYYLVHRARQLGFEPEVILAGRKTNDGMPGYVVAKIGRALTESGRQMQDARVLVMGLTSKENVPDVRESPARALAKELKNVVSAVYGYDPLLADIPRDFGVETVDSLDTMPKVDVVIVTVGHDVFRELIPARLLKLTGALVLVDIRGFYSSEEVRQAGMKYLSL